MGAQATQTKLLYIYSAILFDKSAGSPVCFVDVKGWSYAWIFFLARILDSSTLPPLPPLHCIVLYCLLVRCIALYCRLLSCTVARGRVVASLLVSRLPKTWALVPRKVVLWPLIGCRVWFLISRPVMSFLPVICLMSSHVDVSGMMFAWFKVSASWHFCSSLVVSCHVMSCHPVTSSHLVPCYMAPHKQARFVDGSGRKLASALVLYENI